MAELADKVCMLVALVAPPILVICLRRHGLLLGTLTVWGSLLIAGALLRMLDPASRDGFTAFFDLLWLALGWVVGLAYCLPFHWARQLYLWVRRDRPRGGAPTK